MFEQGMGELHGHALLVFQAFVLGDAEKHGGCIRGCREKIREQSEKEKKTNISNIRRDLEQPRPPQADRVSCKTST